jgi:outer membrane protein assembly factor BamB
MLFDAKGLSNREDLERRHRAIVKRRRIILFSVLGVVLLFILFIALYNFTDIMFGVSENLESAPQNGDWPMFRHDQARTGSTGDGVSPDGTLKWTFTTGGPIHSSPAVVNGVVYFGSRDGYLYALDANTGKELWAFETDSWVDSSPAVVDGVVYCGSNDGNLYAIDAATGTEIWHFQTRYAVRSSPAVADGKVYVGSDDNHLYAVDALTGKELWNLKTNNAVLSSPIVTKGVAVVASMDGSCYGINAANGRHRLNFESGSIISASAAVDNATAYFTNAAGQLIALDITARNWFLENRLIVYWRAMWMYGVAPKPPAPSGYLWSVLLGYDNRVGSSPAVRDGSIYVGSGNSVMSLNEADGSTNWTFAAGDWVLSSPAVTSDAVYFGSNDGHVYGLDKTTGVKLWDYLTGDIVTSSPAVADGTLYIGSEDGVFYAFD